MNCQRTQDAIHGYLDGELDLSASLEFEQHLATCEGCARQFAKQKALRSALKDSGLVYRAPAKLHRRLQSSLRHADKAESRPEVWPWKWMALAAVLVCAVLVGVFGWRGLAGRSGASPDDLLAQELVTDHVRSLMVDHLTDVNSSDQHTVKPWFDGKLDFAPPVKDFSNQGFPLVGGRLEYLNRRPIAALVYQRQKHLINVFIWPVGQSGDSEAQVTVRQGYNLVRWTKAGMTYWAVSDLNSGDLQTLSRLIQEQTPSAK